MAGRIKKPPDFSERLHLFKEYYLLFVIIAADAVVTMTASATTITIFTTRTFTITHKHLLLLYGAVTSTTPRTGAFVTLALATLAVTARTNRACTICATAATMIAFMATT